jgi:hypothetical protein
MESALVGIGAMVLLLAFFGLLSWWEAGKRRAMLRDVTRPTATPTRRFDLVGEVLPADDASLTPWQSQRVAPTGYSVENRQPRHVHNLETGFLVPLATAGGTAVCVTVATGALAWAFGWPARTVLIVFALALVGAWLWRLGVADRLVWSIEAWTKTDLDNDHVIGNPSRPFAVVNPGQARTTAARAERATAEDGRRAVLLAFLDKCYLSGTSEGAHGITASGPDREAYTACRNTLMRLGLARWKNPNRPKGGWVMVTDPATAKAIAENHVPD